MGEPSPFFSYFDRVSIIHLPERTDRLRSLSAELKRAGLSIDDPKVEIPIAPKPPEANGFHSRGVYGNFLSHLGILKKAEVDGLDTVLILEDDAIFSNSFNSRQASLATHLRSHPWDEILIGHSVRVGLPVSSTGIVEFKGNSLWAHCYGVHRRTLSRLIDYLEKTIDRDPLHPDGGKMYIDGALNEFRKKNPDTVCLVTSPCLSVQRGSQSSLNETKWTDKKEIFNLVKNSARTARDTLWRHGLIDIRPKVDNWSSVQVATAWPAK
jgi:glycosyl transferase, family 25